MMSALPSFINLLDPHREVHRKGRDVLLSLAEGQEAEARARMAELEDMSRQVIGQLDLLGVEFTGRRAVEAAA